MQEMKSLKKENYQLKESLGDQSKEADILQQRVA